MSRRGWVAGAVAGFVLVALARVWWTTGDGDGAANACLYDMGASFCESCGKDMCCPEIEACVADDPQCVCVVECLGEVSKGWGGCALG
jgi:hypothetical protein